MALIIWVGFIAARADKSEAKGKVRRSHSVVSQNGVPRQWGP